MLELTNLNGYRQRVPTTSIPTTGTDNRYRQRVPTMGTDDGYQHVGRRQRVPTTGTTHQWVPTMGPPLNAPKINQ